jgi:hypothetical protein
MGKVKAAAIEGQEFAQENYNISRNDFCALAFKVFKPMSIQARAAVEEYDVIQNDLKVYYEEYYNAN